MADIKHGGCWLCKLTQFETLISIPTPSTVAEQAKGLYGVSPSAKTVRRSMGGKTWGTSMRFSLTFQSSCPLSSGTVSGVAGKLSWGIEICRFMTSSYRGTGVPGGYLPSPG